MAPNRTDLRSGQFDAAEREGAPGAMGFRRRTRLEWALLTAAVLVIGAAVVTWRQLIRPTRHHVHVLRRAALVALIVGVIGLGANAFVGGTTNAPDGPVFVLSLLLILQAFLTIGHASQST